MTEKEKTRQNIKKSYIPGYKIIQECLPKVHKQSIYLSEYFQRFLLNYFD